MIKRKDDQWTTIQCPKCKDCHKVLNDKYQLVLQCPYCGATIDLRQYPKARKEDAKLALAAEDAGVRLWNE